jgi:ATP-dependent DNA helicase PIF1
MTKRHVVEALDISLRDILDKEDLPFGGKTDVFGGDFRQTLPIV